MNTLLLEEQTNQLFDQMDSSEQELTPEQAASLYIQGYMVEESSKDPKRKEKENIIQTAYIGATIYGSDNNQVVLTPEQLSVASIVQALTQQDSAAIRNAALYFN